jgi:plasmid replication initiation protein
MKTKNLPALQAKELPEYVIQPNVISQAIYNLNPYARKLIAMAMSLISLKEGEYTVSFKVADFINSLGMEFRKQGNPTKEYIKAAVKECLNSHIEINKPNGDWKGYTWFIESELQDFKSGSTSGWSKITMTFNPKLGEVIQAFKRAFAKISLADLGKLHSRYALRFYELALSYAGFAGKDGNRSGEWYFDKTLDDLRILFQIDKKKYPKTGDFRTYVIDNPLKEINNARMGLWIEPQYLREGKRLMGARFMCLWVKGDEAIIGTPMTEEEQLIKEYPEEFGELFKQELTTIREQATFSKAFPAFQEALAKSRVIEYMRLKYLSRN